MASRGRRVDADLVHVHAGEEPVQQVQVLELVARLEANDWNFTQVAREVGKARKQIQRWVKRFGLRRR